MSESTRQKLLAQLAEAEERLRDAERRHEEALAQVTALREVVAASAEEPRRPPMGSRASDSVVASSPTREKIELFRRLFRGREDVFPKYWESKQGTKKGYAPACANEWVVGKCDRRRVKCGECPHRVLIPVGDQVILDHLKGRHTIGVYALREDETCWFLAADFDKTSWQDDVAAFVETSRGVGLQPAVERSRSGNGAHVWFFFAAPLAASVARRLGCYLITETMTRRHQLGMESYDRLFPNQDTMPRGGFGSLIALPFQDRPRQRGNTVFLDDALTPWPDQWSFLGSVPRLAPEFVEEVVREASRGGQVMGMRAAEVLDDEDSKPWLRPPSGRQPPLPLSGPLPPALHAVLAQRLFVEKAGVPAALLNRIQRLAAFQNPEFYKKERLRLSTAGTPRVICCAEDRPQHLALPRGCRPQLEELLHEHGARLEVDDQRHDGEGLDVTFHGELTPLQALAARALLQHEVGVLVAPPGVGKTVLGTYMVAQRRRSTLILVHRQQLLDQWLAQLAMFLGLGEADIGQIGGGRKQATGRLDVAMLQSLVRKGSVADVVAGYGQVIVDECHHLPAFSFERVLAEAKAHYVLGLTATPQRRDGHHPIIEMQLGPVRYTVDAKNRAAQRPFTHRLIVRETGFVPRDQRAASTIQDYYRELAADEARNRLILDDVIHSIEDRRSPILLTERKDHLELLSARLAGFVRHLVVLQGGMSRRERRDCVAQLASIPDNEERVVLATGRYIGEGFDDARLDTLFLALPVSWKGTLVQYTGRLHRLHPRKTEVRIFDYVDRSVPMLLKMFERRLRGYRAIGYARGEAPLGYTPPEETTIQVDDEALQVFDEDVLETS